MTDYEITIDEIALHGVPPELAPGLGALIEAALAQRGAGAPGLPAPGTVRTTADLAASIAHQVWPHINRATAEGGAR